MTNSGSDVERVQSQAEARVQAWRETGGDTSKLKQSLRNDMQNELFNSATLLRLYTEVLIKERELEEAESTFYGYIEAQRLAIMTANSGATAFPDTQAALIGILRLMLSFVERQGYIKYDYVVYMQEKIEELLSILKAPHQAAFEGILGRISVIRALNAYTDDDYEKALSAAHKHFEKMQSESEDPENVDTSIEAIDSETLYSHALILVLSRGVSEAMTQASLAMKKSPRNIRIALLLTQLLSADDQYVEALMLATWVFKDPPKVHLLLDQLALAKLKRTQIALLERVEGRSNITAEVSNFVSILQKTFHPESTSHTLGSQGSRAVSIAENSSDAPRHRIFSFRRRNTHMSNSASNAKPDGVEFFASRPLSYERDTASSLFVAENLYWASKQYKKAGNDELAQSALNSAKESIPEHLDLEAHAFSHNAMALDTSPYTYDEKMGQFRSALQASPTNLTATLGAVRLMTQDPSRVPSQSDLELAQVLSINLKAACEQSPTRFAAEVWYSLGLLYVILSEEEEARSAFWESVQLDERSGITPFVTLA